MELLEHIVDTVGINHGENALHQRWPGVGAVVRVASVAASSHHIVESGESAASTLVKHLDYSLIVGLIEGDKYSFHNLRSIN